MSTARVLLVDFAERAGDRLECGQLSAVWCLVWRN